MRESLDTCLAVLQPFLAFYGCISARVDREGGGMGSLKAEVAPKGQTRGNDVN